MIRVALTLLALLVTGVFEAPLSNAAPVSDQQFCQAIDNDMRQYASLQVSDCSDVVAFAKDQCRVLGASQDFKQAVESGMTRHAVSRVAAAIVTAYGVAAYCMEYAYLIPDPSQAQKKEAAPTQKQGQAPSTTPGNVDSKIVPGLVV